jgi:ribose transport system permease protein
MSTLQRLEQGLNEVVPVQPTMARIRLLRLLARYATVGVLALMVVVFSIASPHAFFTVSNLLNVLNQCSLTAIIAGGLTITLIVGEFDLSIGYLSSMSVVLVAGLMSLQHLPVLVAVVLAIVAGGAVGGVNGTLVSVARINAVIVTLGMGTILEGVSYTYTNGSPIAAGLPNSFLNFAVDKVHGVPNLVIVSVVVLLVLWVIVRRTDLGQSLRAVGGNAEAARLSGIPVDRIRLFAFVVSGACAAITGILLSSLIGSGQLDAGNGYLLSAFAAVFLGSATLSDGEFHIVGTAIGVLILNTAINGLSIFGVPSSYQNIFTGSLLIVGVGFSTVARRYLRGS